MPASNTLSSTIKTVWTKNMQMQKRENFVGMNIADTKFSDWGGVGSIKFPRQAKINISTLPNYNASITPQAITQIAEEFTPNQIRYFAININLEEDVQTYLDPKQQVLVDAREGFNNEIDYAVMGEYVNADYIIDDGDLKTPSNGGLNNPIDVKDTNCINILTLLDRRMTELNMPQNSRFFVMDPNFKESLLLSERLSKSTEQAERRLEKGFITSLFDIALYSSNNLHAVAGVTHGLAGQGKPICLGSVIEPKIFVSTIDENTAGFWFMIKGTIKFGVITFSEGGEKLIDVQMKTPA